MQFKLTPDFSSKVFTKVGALAKTDIDFSDEQSQIDFCLGFVDSLRKEANLSPAMALGFVQFLCETGIDLEEARSTDKTATEEFYNQERKKLAEAISRIKEGNFAADVAGSAWNGVKWLGNTIAPPGSEIRNDIKGMRDGIKSTTSQVMADSYDKSDAGQKAQQAAAQANQLLSKVNGDYDSLRGAVTGVANWLKELPGKAWAGLQNPEFWRSAAPWLIGGLGLAGGLLPKMMGGGAISSTIGALGGAAGGAAGGALLGKYLSDKDRRRDNIAANGADQMTSANADYVVNGK